MAEDYEMSDEEVSLKDEPGLWRRLNLELSYAEDNQERWTRDSKICEDRYTFETKLIDETPNAKASFPLLWSNIQTLQPAIYLNPPKPQVSRRFKDKDPVARLGAALLERCGMYLIDRFKLHNVMRDCRDDYLLIGIGIARCFFDASFYGSDLLYAYPLARYVHYRDFRVSPGRCFETVRWVSFRSYLSKDELRERFGKKAAGVTLTVGPKGWKEDKDGAPPSSLKQAEVWELWDKRSKRVYWLSPGLQEKFLDVKDDPLSLEGFFPCPKPMLATVSKNNFWPIADYIFYREQAAEIDTLTRRISALEKMIRFAGVHNAAIPELSRIATESIENRLIAASNWQHFSDQGGLKGAMDILPIQEMSEVLGRLYEARQAKINDVYQITGISDIIRGQTVPQETATAQAGKIQFATLRLQDRQMLVSEFGRDLVELLLEIASKHLNDQMFYEIGGVAQLRPQDQELFPQAVKLIRDDFSRGFRIDIETNSTIAMDEESQKASRIEFLTTMGQFADKVSVAAQQMPDMLEPAAEALLFAARSFKEGRTFEATLEAWVDQIKENIEAAKEQPPAPPPIDPLVQQAQIEAQSEMQQEQLRAQVKMEELKLKQQEIQLEAQKLQLENQRLQMEGQLKMQELQLKAQVEATKRIESQAEQAEVLEPQEAPPQSSVSEAVVTRDETGRMVGVTLVERPAQIIENPLTPLTQ